MYAASAFKMTLPTLPESGSARAGSDIARPDPKPPCSASASLRLEDLGRCTDAAETLLDPAEALLACLARSGTGWQPELGAGGQHLCAELPEDATLVAAANAKHPYAFSSSLAGMRVKACAL